MKVIKESRRVSLEFTEDYLLNGRYLSLAAVSDRLRSMECADPKGNFGLRSMLYNSRKCGKYNVETVGGVSCIDSVEPMRTTDASLVLDLTVVKKGGER